MDMNKEWIKCGRFYSLTIVWTNNVVTLPITTSFYFRGSARAIYSQIIMYDHFINFYNHYLKSNIGDNI